MKLKSIYANLTEKIIWYFFCNVFRIIFTLTKDINYEQRKY